MRILLNNKELDLDVVTSLSALLARMQINADKGVAIAINDQVMPRERWPEVQLKDNDTVLVITATQGG